MWKNRAVLVTGGSSGIGKEIALYLSSLGATIVLIGRDEERLQQVQDQAVSECYYFVFDLLKTEEIEKIFQFCKEKNLKLDGMVHAAGIEVSLPIRVNDINQIRTLFQINVDAFLELEKFFIKPQYSNAESSIVVLSSMASQDCAAGMSGYAGAKSAINSIVKVSAKEFIKRRIRVNSIMPSCVDTAMTRRSYIGSNDNFDEYIKNEQPLGLIEPIQVAYLAEFLLSEKAKYITGAAIPIGAGMVC